jgi:thymidine phosphorylase
MVRELGGPSDFVEHPTKHLPVAPIVRPVAASGDGAVAAVNARALGLAIIALGGGRTRPDDQIDHAVGLTELARIGEPVGAERPLCLVYARDDDSATAAAEAVRRAYRLGEQPPERPLVYERIGVFS